MSEKNKASFSSAVTTERTIWCQRCTVWWQESASSKSEFIADMRRVGWRVMAGTVCCPQCVAELNKGDKEVGYRPSRG